MRRWYLFVLTAVLMAFATTALLPDAPAQEPAPRIYLSLDVPGLKNLNDIPPNCSNWNELWPDFGQPHHQSDYEDNGDGVVSPCDVIVLDGDPWHIIWSGPTYYLFNEMPEPGQEPLLIVEPNLAPHDPANPMGEVWHEIWPIFCQEFPIVGWEDTDQSGTITPCDFIVGGDGILYHVEDIRLNIIAEQGGVSTEDDTWSRIKDWFRALGN